MKLHLADPYNISVSPFKLNSGLTVLSKPELKALTGFQARSSELEMEELQGNNVLSVDTAAVP